MKTLILSTVLMLSFQFSSSQNLTNLYKKGIVTLTEDATFGSGNNWKELFYDINASREEGKDGKNKAIVVAPDGRIFMSHRSRHSISLYDKNGNYMKEFGKKGSKDSDFVYMPYVVGILNGKYLATAAADGRMLFFDLNGTWVKTFALDYMPLENAMLGNDKIAILGHTSWKSKNKKLIAIKDFKSGQEKIIWENLTEQEIARSGRVTFTSGGNLRPKLLASPDGNLLVIFPENGEIRTYSPEGKLLKTFVANTGERLTITQKEREEYYQTALENIKYMENKLATSKGQAKEDLEQRITESRQEIKKFLDPANYPEKLPAISQAMYDSDNNLLLFTFTRERDENRFIVYTLNPDGEKVCESSFICDKYNLNFSNSRFLFYKGNIIGFQESKDSNFEIPLRMVRFKLTN